MKDIVTPLGHLRHVYITGKGKLDYKNCYRLEASIALETGSVECETLVATITNFWNDYNIKNGPCHSLGMSHSDETGMTLFKFSTRVKFKDGLPNRVPIFSAGKLGKPPPEIALSNKSIGDGSVGYISGTLVIYDTHTVTNKRVVGCKLVLNAIQLIDFKPRIDEDFGFVSHKGGYQGNTLNKLLDYFLIKGH